MIKSILIEPSLIISSPPSLHVAYHLVLEDNYTDICQVYNTNTIRFLNTSVCILTELWNIEVILRSEWVNLDLCNLSGYLSQKRYMLWPMFKAKAAIQPLNHHFYAM